MFQGVDFFVVKFLYRPILNSFAFIHLTFKLNAQFTYGKTTINLHITIKIFRVAKHKLSSVRGKREAEGSIVLGT